MGERRNPSRRPTPLDWSSFYIESLKYGPGSGAVEGVTRDQITAQLETLLRDADVSSMTGAELIDACDFYAESLARALGLPVIMVKTLWLDGLMHGIAFAAGVRGEHRHSRASS